MLVALLTITATIGPAVTAAPTDASPNRIAATNTVPDAQTHLPSTAVQDTTGPGGPEPAGGSSTPPSGTAPGDAEATPAHPADGVSATPTPTPTHDPTSTPPNQTERVNTTVHNVTLVTGQTVIVSETDGERSYSVDADLEMRTLETQRGTYVYPETVDFQTFDRQLFNVDLLIEQNLTDARTDAIPVIVESTRGPQPVGQESTISVASATPSVTATQTLETIGAQAATITKRDATDASHALRTADRVDTVHLDVAYKVQLDEANAIVDANSARADYDVDGTGVTVAVLDTGVDDTHPDVDVANAKDFTGEGTTDDLHGHGTHVAGIIAGTGEASGGNLTGIAPNATIYNGRVLGENGYGSTSDIIAAIEWAADEDVDVISMSLGGTSRIVRSNDPYTEAIQYAVDNGTPVVIAAGNSYNRYTIGSPGVVEDAITVGSTDKTGELSSFSSRGPTPIGYFLKPTVVAPGSDVESAAAPQAGYEEPYTTMSGTSMATPVVSGVVALLIEEHPDWGPDRLKSTVTTTADPLETGTPYDQGAGRVNATDALDAEIVVSEPVLDFGTLETGGNHSRVVTVTNPTDENVTLNVSVNGSSFDDTTVDTWTNVSTLDLRPGESTDIAVTVNATVPLGVYAGRLSFDEGEYTSIFGFSRGANVTVTKTPRTTGGDVSFDEVEIIYDTSDYQKEFSRTEYVQNGSVTFTVTREGTYHVVSTGETETDADEPILVSQSVTVDQPEQTVHLNESNAVPITLDTSELTNETGTLVNATLDVGIGISVGNDESFFSTTQNQAETRTFYVSNSSAITAEISGGFVPANETANTTTVYDVPEWYAIGKRIQSVDGPTVLSVDPGTFGTATFTYHRTAMDTDWKVFVRPELVESPRVTVPLLGGNVGPRSHQRIHYSDGYGEGRIWIWGADDGNWGLFQTSQYYDLDRGAVEDDIGTHPLIGWYDLSFYSQGAVVQTKPQIAVGEAPYQYTDTAPDESALYIDGELVADNTGRDGLYELVEYQDGDSFRLYSDARNNETALSTRTVMNVTGEFHDDGDSTPPKVEDIDVHDLNETNAGPNGELSLTVTVSDEGTSEVSNVSVYVNPGNATAVPSVNDSGQWTEASVEPVPNVQNQYVATVDVGDVNGTLDVAVGVENTLGYRTNVTVFDAYHFRDVPPVARFFLNRSVEGSGFTAPIDEPLQLDARHSSDNLGIISYDWTIANQTATGSTANVTFDDIGTYNVSLTVTDTGGHTETLNRTITIVDRTDPTPALSVSDSTIDVDETVTFDATNSSDNVGVETYKWDLDGDGETDASGGEVTHAFDEAGDYSVELTVVDRSGNEARTTTTITVEPADDGGDGDEGDDGDDGDDGDGGGGGGGGPTGDDPQFKITDISLNTTDISVGDTVLVSATYKNEFDESRQRDATLRVGGEDIEERPITLVPNFEMTVNFTYTFREAGTTRIQVDRTTYGFVNVESDGTDDSEGGSTTKTTAEPPATTEPATTAVTTSTTTESSPDSSSTTNGRTDRADADGSIPGFGIATSLIALLATLAIVGRRRY